MNNKKELRGYLTVIMSARNLKTNKDVMSMFEGNELLYLKNSDLTVGKTLKMIRFRYGERIESKDVITSVMNIGETITVYTELEVFTFSVKVET